MRISHATYIKEGKCGGRNTVLVSALTDFTFLYQLVFLIFLLIDHFSLKKRKVKKKKLKLRKEMVRTILWRTSFQYRMKASLFPFAF